MSIRTHEHVRNPPRTATTPQTPTPRLVARIALGIAGGLLLGAVIHLSSKHEASNAETELTTTSAQAPQHSTAPIPPLVLTGIVRDASTQRPYALIAVGGMPAREFHLGDQLAEGVQLADIAEDAVTVVGNGRALRIALTYIAPPQPADPRMATRTASDWRNAASARSQSEPASPPATVIAPPKGFAPPSSTSTDRAVWRARQASE